MCTKAKQKYGDKVMEEKKRVAYYFASLRRNTVVYCLKSCVPVPDELLLFSHPGMSDSLWPHELQHASPPCPSSSPKVYPSSCPLHRWCYPDISSSDALFPFCLQSFPASGTFPMNQPFASDDKNTGASASASVQVNIQDWSPARLTGFPWAQGTFRGLL